MSIQTSDNNKRIAKNTLFLYVRMLLIMAVTLYTSRVVLKTLGVEDFGIYNVVGGIVAMLGILNGAMSVSTQRYLTFELGKKNILYYHIDGKPLQCSSDCKRKNEHLCLYQHYRSGIKTSDCLFALGDTV